MNALEISNLTKTYKSGVEAVKGISLSVKPGDFYGLLGPNGAGKSTTIGIVSSLVNKTAGQVKVFGHDLDTEKNAAKQCIGLVPQEINFNMFEPVKQIVMQQAGYYGVNRNTANERADYFLNKLGLYEKRNTVSRSLSGGMKRRLMIVRALVHQPRLLILDEPTAGVDIELRRSMWAFLKEMNENGTTIILTTHYLEEAEHLCKNIGIIDQGVLVDNRPTKELINQLNLETYVLDTDFTGTELNLDNFVTRLGDEGTLEVDMEKSNSVNDLFAQLSAKNIGVRSMRNKSNRLEELFIRLVEKTGV